jgi:nitrate/TMAO reductase-like tetraheme cytochrome c subunit
MKQLKWISVSALLLICASAFASPDKTLISAPDNATYKEECGSCHMAYPPKFLIADDWRRVMDGLDKHFGQDASLNAQDRQTILDYLRSNASSNTRWRSADSSRITDTKWFKEKHHEMSGKVYSSNTIKSASNCTACHAQAERGLWHSGHEHARSIFNWGEDDD